MCKTNQNITNLKKQSNQQIHFIKTSLNLNCWRIWEPKEDGLWHPRPGSPAWGLLDPKAHTDGPDKTPGSLHTAHGSSLLLSQQFYHLQVKRFCPEAEKETTFNNRIIYSCHAVVVLELPGKGIGKGWLDNQSAYCFINHMIKYTVT